MSEPTKRVNPYTRLQRECRQWAFNVLHPRRVFMFRYEQKALPDLYQRVAAADQLGFDVALSVNGDLLEVHYRKRHDDPPWDIAP